MRPFYPALACVIFLVCAMYSGATLATDPPLIEQRVTTLEKSLRTQNQQLHEIQKRLDGYDQNNSDFTNIYEKTKLTNELTKNYEDKNLWFFMASLGVSTISIMIFLGLIAYGIYAYKRMNSEIKKARDDSKKNKKYQERCY